ncbi:MAG: phosphoribosyl-AMP cyclohydrolase [Armatimonadetes bacterium]|nr:phosphoribosyl-AMP cyclohydrolase [Armatimonadota bacterium]MDE2206695.1 phosphoribosyl-AMP cyclohydrolase [Armatimonadota bacterium]
MSIPATLQYDADGLVPVAVQDYESRDVLMLAFMNREALESTIATGRVTYWSRSRRKLWVKGETSGFRQYLKAIYVNCENNSLLIEAEQIGAACHEGYRTCYYRRLTPTGDALEQVQEQIAEPY